MGLRAASVLLVVVGALWPTTASAAVVVDQSQDISVGTCGVLPETVHTAIGQTFTAGITGSLVQVDMYPVPGADANPTDDPPGSDPTDRTFQIRAVAAGVPTGPVLASTTILAAALPPAGTAIPVSFSPPPAVVAGATYAILMRRPATGPIWARCMGIFNPNPYPGGTTVVSVNDGGAWAPFPSVDLAFRTYVDVPEPDTSATLTVIRAGAGSGTVTGGPIHCPPTCSAQVELGTFVPLHATAAAGSEFEGWSGECTGTGDCNVVVNGDTTVAARFEPTAQPPPQSGFDLSLSAAPSGGAQVGSPLTFSFTGSNAGPDAASGVSISGTASGEFTLARTGSRAPAGDCAVSGQDFTCELGQIASGGSAGADLVLTPTRGGSLTVEASIEGEGSDTDATNDSASASADVSVVCTMKGTPGDDVLSGTPGVDVICGGAGGDVISGWAGDDIVRGGRGADIVRGGAGDDLVLGMSGPDRLRGGGGTDACDITESDRPIGCESLAA